MKHKFMLKNLDGSWMILCPIEQTTFSTSVWNKGIKDQVCPNCNFSIHEDLIISQDQQIQNSLLNQLKEVARKKEKTLAEIFTEALHQYIALEKSCEESLKHEEFENE